MNPMNKEMIPDFWCRGLNHYLFEHASLILMTLDAQGRILEANQFTYNLVGQDIRGKPLADVLVDFNGSFDLQSVRRQEKKHLLNVVSYTGLPQTFYFRFMEHNGNILAVGELDHQETEELRKNLIQVNNEFSNLNRELQKKNSELARLNELKNHLLGMAAHDLRTPLGSIRSMGEFLLDEAGDDLSPEHIQFLEIIHGSSNFMLSLLDELLDVARIEAGKLDLDFQPTDIISLIQSSVDINRVLAERKNIQILLENPGSLPPVELDPIKMEQVMHNLLSNAVKFSSEDTVIRVSVSLDADHVRVAVADQGLGIPEEEIQKLFQPFSKISVQAPGGEKSTGLGLAIVKKIVQGHKGNIWAESTVNRGSTFFFTLPVNAGKHSS